MRPVLEKPAAAHFRNPSYVQLLWGTGKKKDRPETRILISFESGYQVYRDVVAGAVEIMRPEVEVTTADLAHLDEEVRSLRPDLVICGRADGGRPPPGVPAWVELPLTPTRPATVYICGKRSEKSNPTLEVLLYIIDEVRKSSREEK